MDRDMTVFASLFNPMGTTPVGSLVTRLKLNTGDVVNRGLRAIQMILENTGHPIKKMTSIQNAQFEGAFNLVEFVNVWNSGLKEFYTLCATPFVFQKDYIIDMADIKEKCENAYTTHMRVYGKISLQQIMYVLQCFYTDGAALAGVIDVMGVVSNTKPNTPLKYSVAYVQTDALLPLTAPTKHIVYLEGTVIPQSGDMLALAAIPGRMRPCNMAKTPGCELVFVYYRSGVRRIHEWLMTTLPNDVSLVNTTGEPFRAAVLELGYVMESNTLLFHQKAQWRLFNLTSAPK
ncbi:protein ORF32 [Lake sturgeon herpesvirus]|nr:protein ORF32 [Lake sturgeon herpesvirus]